MNRESNYKEFLESCQLENSSDKELYGKLYEEFLEGLMPEDAPRVTAFAGAPGTGKTTWRKTHFAETANIHVHDMDAILVRLPGYQKDLKLLSPKEAFENWWPTAQKFANQLVDFAIQKKYSILYDRTCGTEESFHALRQAKQQGYQIHLIGFRIEPEIGLRRICEREKAIGRAVTPEIFEEYRARFSALWPYYLEFADHIELYDNSGVAPIKIFPLETNAHLYDTFLLEGEPYHAYFRAVLLESEGD